MSNNNNIYLLLFLSSLFFISCNLKNEEPDPLDNKSLKEHIIPVNNAIIMHNEYNELRTDLLKDTLKEMYSNPDFMDSKFAWFSLKDVKAYLTYIEAMQKANPEEDISGIRIYFAAYPNKKMTEGKHNKYPGQQTFFMVPTVSSKDLDTKFNVLNHLPFYISTEENDNSIKGDFVVINDLLYPYDKKERLNAFYSKNKKESTDSKKKIALTGRRVSTVFNEGEACPPPFPND